MRNRADGGLSRVPCSAGPARPVHEAQLRLLLDRVRDGFDRLDAGEIDAFELDKLIHRYKRSARELWKFCGQTGSAWVTAVRMLEFWERQGEVPDWWAAGEPRRRR